MGRGLRLTMLLVVALLASAAPAVAQDWSPGCAPKAVRAILVAANQIIGKPYKWGGGHGRLFDSGYDCSGSVSYALIRSGLLGYPMVSGTLAHWGLKGAGKYVTIFANKAHVYIEVAGLRLDTSEVGDPSGKSGV